MPRNAPSPATSKTRRSDENAVSNAIQVAHGRGAVRLLRNNVGALPDRSGRLVRYGLGQSGATRVVGTSDLIGWRTITITPDMVGQTIAQFVAIEVKDRATATPEQEAFIDAVNRAGGLAGVAHSPDEAAAILRL
jgi:hypothetical protein